MPCHNRVPESPLYPMDIHLLSVHHILLYILHTTMRLNPLYLLPLALTVLGQNQVPYVPPPFWL
jgi:hypothetical protein